MSVELQLLPLESLWVSRMCLQTLSVYQEGVEPPNVEAGWLLVKLLALQGKKFRHPQLSSPCDI